MGVNAGDDFVFIAFEQISDQLFGRGECPCVGNLYPQGRVLFGDILAQQGADSAAAGSASVSVRS